VTKNLSVNDIDRGRYLAKGDDGCCKVVERKKAAVELLVAHQEFAKAVEPAVANLHDSATGLFVGMAFFALDFSSPTHHMGNIAMLFDGIQMLGTSPR